MISSVWSHLNPGSKWQNWVTTGLESTPKLPVLVVHGARSGPTLVVTGGVHGDEYEGPAAIQDIYKELDPEKLSGTWIGLPVLNMDAWRARTRVSFGDGVNLNRVFGQKAPSATGRLASWVFENFIIASDFVIDLHSGGLALTHLPLIGWYGSGLGEAESLARRFNANLWPWVIPDAVGVLSYEASRLGKLALGAEWLGGGRLDTKGAHAYANGIRNFLAINGMILNSEPVPVDPRKAIAGDYQNTSVGGLFIPSLKLGDPVQFGQEIGTLRDELGDTTHVVQAERTGLLAGLPHLPLLQKNDRVAYIG